jgi:hypothetical protein
MRRSLTVLALGAALLAAASPAAAQRANENTDNDDTDIADVIGAVQGVVNRFADPATTTMMRPTPRIAVPQELVSRQIVGYDEKVIDAFDVVPAIVVAPSGMSQAEKDEFSETFRATPDGYFASLTREGYDVVINGTLAYSVAPESLRLQPRTGRYHVQKSEGETDIAFSDLGGDYLIQFICQEYSEGEIGGCISDDDAVAFFERIVPLGGGLE